MHRIIAVIVLTIMIIQTTACGMLLYPERQGQAKGQIDPGVAALDAAGLFLFIVPGLVAFGVDFINGTIYLPASKQAAVQTVDMDPASMKPIDIGRVVAAETGYEVDLAGADIRRIEVDTQVDLLAGLESEPAVLNHRDWL